MPKVSASISSIVKHLNDPSKFEQNSEFDPVDNIKWFQDELTKFAMKMLFDE
jgi:hypothetical protein